MYYDDHGPPRFHAGHAGGQAKLRIDTVEVIESSLEVVFTVGFRDDGTMGVHSRPLDGKRLLVSHAWGESKPIEAGGTAWSTRWVFTYRAEREARDAWQHVTGSVVLDRVRGERFDQREKFARAIASTAGWNVSD